MDGVKGLIDCCLLVKVIAVELASLAAFLGILVVVVFWEWNHLAPFLHK